MEKVGMKLKRTLNESFNDSEDETVELTEEELDDLRYTRDKIYQASHYITGLEEDIAKLIAKYKSNEYITEKLTDFQHLLKGDYTEQPSFEAMMDGMVDSINELYKSLGGRYY